MFEKMNGIEDEEIKEISDTLSRHELETIYEFQEEPDDVEMINVGEEDLKPAILFK